MVKTREQIEEAIKLHKDNEQFQEKTICKIHDTPETEIEPIMQDYILRNAHYQLNRSRHKRKALEWVLREQEG